MENPISDIHDWDWELVLPSPGSSPSPSSPLSEGEAGGGEIIRADYFSATPASDADVTSEKEGDGDESDNPSWVDPSDISIAGGVNMRSRKRCRSPAYSSCSSSPVSGSDEHFLLDSIIQPHTDCCSGVGVGFGEVEGESDHDDGDHEVLRSGFEEEEEEEKKVVWWKVPMEVVRYCVMKVRVSHHVWSLSMVAAALMGFVILRRRYLHKIKRKALGIQLNVTSDDKKVSQFMSRAARLNEAFSVVKRVPIIRPALPAPGMAPWPAMSFR